MGFVSQYCNYGINIVKQLLQRVEWKNVVQERFGVTTKEVFFAKDHQIVKSQDSGLAKHAKQNQDQCPSNPNTL